jgi:hypothetical protein
MPDWMPPTSSPEDSREGTGGFFEGFDTFGGGLGGDVFTVVPVTGGRTVFHRSGASHATVLFVEFAVDFDYLTGGFVATGEETATHHAVGEGERFYDVTGFCDAAICKNGNSHFASRQ